MTPEDIKAAIARAGTSQAAIARHLGKKPQSIARVINGTMRSALIERELSKITGKPIRDDYKKPGRRKTEWNGQLRAAA